VEGIALDKGLITESAEWRDRGVMTSPVAVSHFLFFFHAYAPYP